MGNIFLPDCKSLHVPLKISYMFWEASEFFTMRNSWRRCKERPSLSLDLKPRKISRLAWITCLNSEVEKVRGHFQLR